MPLYDMNLTKAEHRILQMFLNLGGTITTSQIVESIVAGGSRSVRYPGEYVYRLRRKIAPDFVIDMIRLGEVRYVLRRTKPLRDRAAYMRNYRRARKASRLTPDGQPCGVSVSSMVGAGRLDPHQQPR
jgi:hypothetical protein